MLDHSIDERLHKLNEEFRKFMESLTVREQTEKTTPEELALFFGLTTKQAKLWLLREPNYLSDDLSQHKDEDDDPMKTSQNLLP